MATVRYRKIKVVLVGDSYVGKTALSNVFVHNSFPELPSPGIGGFALRRSLENPRVTLKIWDTAGTEKFRFMLPYFIRNTVCVMIVYDMNDRNTFQSVKDVWLDYLSKHGPEHVVKVLVANKSDIKERAVTKEEGRRLAEINNMLYFETSARLRINVDEIFTESAVAVERNVHINVPPGRKLVRLGLQRNNCCCE